MVASPDRRSGIAPIATGRRGTNRIWHQEPRQSLGGTDLSHILHHCQLEAEPLELVPRGRQ